MLGCVRAFFYAQYDYAGFFGIYRNVTFFVS